MYPKDYNPSAFVSCSGERYKSEYIGEPDDNGVIQLVKVGEVDLFELHARDADLNDVNLLYERFCNGDISALSQRQGTFMDALGMPRDLRGMYDMVGNFQRSYDNLPDEMREKYTFEQFLEQAGSSEWLKDYERCIHASSSSVVSDSPSSSPPV